MNESTKKKIGAKSLVSQRDYIDGMVPNNANFPALPIHSYLYAFSDGAHYGYALACEEKDEKIADLVSIIKGYKTEITEADAEIKRITKIANNNARSCDSLSQEIDRLRDEIKDKDAEIMALKEEIKAQSDSIFRLMEQDADHHNRALSAESMLKVAKEALEKYKNIVAEYRTGGDDWAAKEALETLRKMRSEK